MNHTNIPVSKEKAQSINRAWGNVTLVIGKTIRTTLKGVEQEVSARTFRASNELRNSALRVLRGKRSGRMYRVPTTKQRYRASAPGEPPAVRTGLFRNSWGSRIHVEKRGKHFIAVASIQSNIRVGKYLLGDLLEYGAGNMGARPYKQAVRNMAMPKVIELYKKPYK